MADERPAASVLRDVAEHPVLDLVPFARAGRKVAHGNNAAQSRGPAPWSFGHVPRGMNGKDFPEIRSTRTFLVDRELGKN
jgi:hypothetical protein